MFVLVLATLLAMAAAQCQLAGNTYTRVDGTTGGTVSTTYGAWVSDWLPSFRNVAQEADAYTIWTQESDFLWEAMDVSTDLPNCKLGGQYNLLWSSDCTQVTYTALSDQCSQRHDFYHGNTFAVFDKLTGESCLDAGNTVTTRLNPSALSPILSNEPSTYVFGLDQFSILSVGSQGAIFQRWQHTPPSAGSTADNIKIVDLTSYPATLSCPMTTIGAYTISSISADSCQATLCIADDACAARWELLAGIAFNGGDSYSCPPVTPPAAVDGMCSPPGKQWLRHPSLCTDQEVPGGCFFCSGIAKGQKAQWCLNREGEGCNQIFESATAVTICNMEFECPASVSGASLFIIFVAILALFLQ